MHTNFSKKQIQTKKTRHFKLCALANILQIKMSKFLFLPFLCLMLLLATTNANANMFNKFRKGFYFEKYSNAEEAKAELLKLHPVGSDAGEVLNTLKGAGCVCLRMDSEKLDKAKINNKKIKHLTDVVHCEVSIGLINRIAWRAGIMIVKNKIDDIGISKEYIGL